jgi:hypothetical protein
MYAENFRLNGIQKDYYPPVAPIAPDVVEASFDADGNLMMRGAALTDEGTFRVNFANTSLRVSIGTCTFTNGSDIVTGTAFNTYDVKAGDYVNIDGHAESTLVQIDTITPTQIILETPYTGATTTGVASRQIVRSFTGTGATTSVASGAATIAAGTTASAVTVLGRFVDVAPLVYRAGLSISQRIINQTINIGLNDEGSPTKWFARFQADGTTNTTIKCQTARNPTIAPTGNEIQETVVTIPNGLTTATSLEYRVELLTEEVVFYINEIRVARHTRVIPSQYDTMGAGVAVLNGATPPATNTNIILDYITCKNHNKLEIGVMSASENIQATQVPLTPFSFSQVGVIPINTDLLVIDCSQLRSLSIQCTSIGTTGVITGQWSNDPTLAVRQNGQLFDPIGGGISGTFNTTALRITNVIARYFILRLTTATTGGTTTLLVNGLQSTIPTYVNTQAVSGTVTANLGANSVVTNVGSTAQGASTHTNIVSNATNSLIQIKSGATVLNNIHCSNISATGRWLKIFNSLSASVVMGTTNATLNYFIPAGQSVSIDCGAFGIRLPTGFSLAITSGIVNNDNTATGVANEVVVSTTYF